MRRASIVEIERYRLSNGSTVRVTRLGRTYNFNRWGPGGENSEIKTNLTRAQAMDMLANALRADVLELSE